MPCQSRTLEANSNNVEDGAKVNGLAGVSNGVWCRPCLETSTTAAPSGDIYGSLRKMVEGHRVILVDDDASARMPFQVRTELAHLCDGVDGCLIDTLYSSEDRDPGPC